jgi:hypothetical protein
MRKDDFVISCADRFRRQDELPRPQGQKLAPEQARVVAHLVKANIKISLSMPGWKMVTSVINRKMSGMDKIISTILIKMASMIPPK